VSTSNVPACSIHAKWKHSCQGEVIPMLNVAPHNEGDSSRIVRRKAINFLLCSRRWGGIPWPRRVLTFAQPMIVRACKCTALFHSVRVALVVCCYFSSSEYVMCLELKKLLQIKWVGFYVLRNVRAVIWDCIIYCDNITICFFKQVFIFTSRTRHLYRCCVLVFIQYYYTFRRCIAASIIHVLISISLIIPFP
jgi:hypothetical protein